MTDNKEVVVLKGQISKLENQANELQITSSEEMEHATEIKAKLKDIGKSIKERKEAITKPLNEALKSARELFAPLEKAYDNAEEIVAQKMLAYKKKVDEEARAKEAKIAADFEAGKIKKVETVERKVEQIERVEKTIQTDHGKVQFRKIKKVSFAVLSQLDPETIVTLARNGYIVWDEVKARKDALAGMVVPATQVYEVETV